MAEAVDTLPVTKCDSRSKWAHPVEFVLSCIGYSVGLGNVWRFPYLCYKHGGAAFLLVYLFLQLTIGKPLYFMELSMSQYASKGPVRVWDMIPAARGVGLSMCLISLNISVYYNVLMAYILYYFFASFFPTLPWDTCEEEYGDVCFTDRGSISVPPVCKVPQGVANSSISCTCSKNQTLDKLYPNCTKERIHSSNLFFNKKIIQESANLSEFGTPSWKLTLLLLLAWIVILICMIRGIKSTGKLMMFGFIACEDLVVYFTATFPYVVLLILLVRGLTLDGSIDGVKFFIVPKWIEMTDIQLWIDATGQMFFSLGLSMGGIMMYGSYNHFHHPVYKDAVIISSMDLITSIMAGFVIFSTFGYMAKKTSKGILDVADTSYGLAFIAYPETLSTLTVPNLWAFLFFFMLFTLGMDSQFALLETVTTYLIDDFVWCRRNKTALRLGFGLVLYALGIILVCPGGQYIINIIDVYGSSYPLCVISLLEVVAVMWIYGTKRFLDDLQYMLGKKPAFLPYWYFVWTFWSPLFLSGLFITVVGMSETPKYNDGSQYGPGVLACCWILYIVTLSPVPIWFILHTRAQYYRYSKTGTFQAKRLLEPSHRWGPADGTHEAAIKRENTVWADVLDWEIFRNTQISDNISTVPGETAPAPAPEPQVETTETTPAGIEIRITPAPNDCVDPP